jgi:anti-sigma factor RsiW
MDATDQDIELCELYLDHELSEAERLSFEARVNATPSLRVLVDRLRGQRHVRLEVMSMTFDTDAASVERLVASVRAAQATEAMARRSFWRRPSRTVFAAAASIAFGLMLGVVLQGRETGRWTTSTVATDAGAPIVDGGNVVSFGAAGSAFTGYGQFAVSIVDRNGRECVKVRFHSADQAKQFLDSINGRTGNRPMQIGGARMIDETY